MKRRRPAAKRRGKKSVSRQKELLPPRAVLISRLDDRASLIVRALHPCCVTCRRTRDLTCSHIFRRRCTETRHDVEEGGNLVTQCMRCNGEHGRRPQKLMTWFIQKHGLAVYSILRDRFVTDEYVEDHVLAERLKTLSTILKAIPAEKIRVAHERAFRG